MTQAAIHTHTRVLAYLAWARGQLLATSLFPFPARHFMLPYFSFTRYPPSIPKSYWLPCFFPSPSSLFRQKCISCILQREMQLQRTCTDDNQTLTSWLAGCICIPLVIQQKQLAGASIARALARWPSQL